VAAKNPAASHHSARSCSARQRDAAGPVGSRRRGWFLAWLALDVAGSPAGERGVGQDGEGDEQDGQRHQGVAPALGLDQPAGQRDVDDAGEPGDHRQAQQGLGPLGAVAEPG
jgi:hypothetical protein